MRTKKQQFKLVINIGTVREERGERRSFAVTTMGVRLSDKMAGGHKQTSVRQFRKPSFTSCKNLWVKL
jgi:hypothetical protein